MLDMSLMAKFLVQGRDAEAVLNRVCANDVAVPVGRIVYTQWLNERGGHRGRPHRHPPRPRTGSSSSSTDLIHRRIAPWIERHAPRRRARDRHRRHLRDDPAHRPGPALARAARAPDERRPVERGVPVPDRARRSTCTTPGCSRCGSPTSASWAGSCTSRPSSRSPSTTRCSRPGADLGYRNVGLGAMNSLRLEKAYRDYGLDIDNTDTPLDVGLGFAVAWDKPGGLHRARGAARAARRAGPPKRRLVQFLLEDPEPLLYGGEPVLRDGRVVRLHPGGRVRPHARRRRRPRHGRGRGRHPRGADRGRPVRDRHRREPLPGARLAPPALRPGPAPRSRAEVRRRPGVAGISDRIRAFSGSNSGAEPATATVTGYRSPKYSTRSRVPTLATSAGRYAMSRCFPTDGPRAGAGHERAPSSWSTSGRRPGRRIGSPPEHVAPDPGLRGGVVQRERAQAAPRAPSRAGAGTPPCPRSRPS